MSFNPPSSSQQPPDQQQGGYNFGDYNFGQQQPQQQQPYQYGGGFGGQVPPPPPPKRNNTARTCLLLFGCVSIATVVICGCFLFLFFQFRETIVATMWIQIASDDNTLTFEDADDLDIICPGSQAERFTAEFQLRYPQGVDIILDDETSMESSGDGVGFQGTLTDNATGEIETYEAVFYTSSSDGLPILGCVERIEQLQPRLSVE